MAKKEKSPVDTLLQLKKTDLFAGIGGLVLEYLSPALERVHLDAGKVLFQQGEQADAMYVVVEGKLDVIEKDTAGKERSIAEVSNGFSVGEIQFFAGGYRTATVTAREKSKLIKFTSDTWRIFNKDAPDAAHMITILIHERLRRDRLREIIPGLFGISDYAAIEALEKRCQWLRLKKGDVLFRKGDPGDCMYVVVSGRLRAKIGPKTGLVDRTADIGRGETLGEIAVYANENRTAEVHAIRDCELLKISKPVFESLHQEFPQLNVAVSKILIGRLRKAESFEPDAVTHQNLAVIPLGPDVPVAEFAAELADKLSAFGKTNLLIEARLSAQLGESFQIPLNDSNALRIDAFLDKQEPGNRYVVFQGDHTASHWNARCLQRADHILLVGNADGDPAPGEIEQKLMGGAPASGDAMQSLLLLHKNSSKLPEGTRRWLTPRKIDRYHHLHWPANTDMWRLARFLSGNAVGVVLSGGGARCVGQIGSLKALKEAGIPIDVIGGVSGGGIFSAQYAMGWSFEKMREMNIRYMVEEKPFNAVTIPMISLIGKKKVDHISKEIYGDTRIEDLWHSYFCLSCDLTTCDAVVHDSGLLWKATRASSCLPAILAPMIEKNHLYIDGSTIDNLPFEIMQSRCPGPVIPINATPLAEFYTDYTYENMPSPWKIFYHRINPFKQPIKFPGIAEILIRTTSVVTNAKIERLKETNGLLLDLPIEKFGLLEFDAYDKIVEAGYEYTKRRIDEWHQQDIYPEMKIQA